MSLRRLRHPILCVLIEFSVRDVAHGNGEPDVAGFAEDLAAERVSQLEEAGGGEVGDVAPGQFHFDGLELSGQGFGADLPGGDELFAERFHFDGAQVLDFELELATPLDEGIAGDLEFGGNFVKGPILDAEFDEPLLLEYRAYKPFCLAWNGTMPDPMRAGGV